jgi:hypothetical protein
MGGEFTAVSVRMQSLAPRNIRPLNADAIELGCCLVYGRDEDSGSTAQQRENSGHGSTRRPRRHWLTPIAVPQLGAVQDFAENLEVLLVAIKPRHHCHGFPAFAVPLSPRPCLELQ